MSDNRIELEQSCAASPEEVWRMLVDPERWWGEGIELEPYVGGLFHEPWQDSSGEHHTRGQVTELETNRLLKLSWRDDDWSFETAVEIRLREEGKGCGILLTHSGWANAPEGARSRLTSSHRAGWEHHLGNLSACAEAQSPGK